MTDVIDIDVERYNPVVAERRYRAEGRPEAEVKMLTGIAAAIYKCDPEEIRQMVADRRKNGLPLY